MVSKKKKKPASNPARGVATTSLPSKAKVQEAEEEKSQQVAATVAETENATTTESTSFSNINVKDNTQEAQQTKDKELSPEEYAAHLEDNEAEVFIEAYGEKAIREAKRTSSRLEDERRVLRESRNLARIWFNIESFMDETEIEAIIQEEREKYTPPGSTTGLDTTTYKIEIWKLHRILESLGFQQLHIREVIQAGIISVDDAIKYLVMFHAEEQLPSPKYRILRAPKGSQFLSDIPVSEKAEKRIEIEAPKISIRDNSREATVSQPASEVVSSESEDDDDIDPDQLISRWFQYMKKRSKLTGVWNTESGKKSKKGPKELSAPRTLNKQQLEQVNKLNSKIERINMDPLFESQIASEIWLKEVEEQRQDAIAVARSQKKSKAQAEATTGESRMQESLRNDEGKHTASSSSLPSPDTDTFDMTMFEESEQTREVKKTDQNTSTQIRDFGKVSETNPLSKKILDEALKSRYTNVTAVYHSHAESSTAFASELLITWNTRGGLPESFPVDVAEKTENAGKPRDCVYSIQTFKSSDSKSIVTSFKMVNIGCPSKTQAESLIATIALFRLFPDDKFHSRLNTTWKAFWADLVKEAQDEENFHEKSLVKWVHRTVENLAPVNLSSNLEPKHSSKSKAVGERTSLFGMADPLNAEELQSLYKAKISSQRYQYMLKGRHELPIWKQKSELLEVISNNQITIVRGETGCGKSTQLPAYILEECLAAGQPCRIFVTEPRRISAISLAKRVCEELGDHGNDVGTNRSLVGYSIRHEPKFVSKTRLIYATTGVVMRMCEQGNNLQELTHLILDEVHERTLESDFLLLVLKATILKKRPDLKIILMSATVDSGKFSEYFNNAPVISVPGRTFPVQTYFLEDAVEMTSFGYGDAFAIPDRRAMRSLEDSDNEDSETTAMTLPSSRTEYNPQTLATLEKLDERNIYYDLITQLIQQIATRPEYKAFSQAILVFLPGWAEIQRMKNSILGDSSFQHGWELHTLHSQVATEEQERVFLRPPHGVRKIVLATNIAETGITIPDITCVIDTCKSKEKRFDERRQLSKLQDIYISRANAKQRRGRAGRVQEGLCFHLVTKAKHDQKLPENATPEILRLSLQEVVLRIKTIQIGKIEETFKLALDPPSSKNVSRAIDQLQEVKALSRDEELTPLGKHLADLPVDVTVGKVLLLGVVFSCVDVAVTIAALLSNKSPWIQASGDRDRKDAEMARASFATGESDLLTTYKAYSEWRRRVQTLGASEVEFCRKNWLNNKDLYAIEELKLQLFSSLADSGIMRLEPEERSALQRARYMKRGGDVFFLVPERYNHKANDIEVVTSAIAASFYPKIMTKEGNGYRDIVKNQPLRISSSSINKHSNIQWLSYYSIFKNTYNPQPQAQDTTKVNEVALALLCGDAEFKLYAGAMMIDTSRLRFLFSSWRGMIIVGILRKRFAAFTARKWINLKSTMSEEEENWLNLVVGMLGRDNLKSSIELRIS